MPHAGRLLVPASLVATAALAVALAQLLRPADVAEAEPSTAAPQPPVAFAAGGGRPDTPPAPAAADPAEDGPASPDAEAAPPAPPEPPVPPELRITATEQVSRLTGPGSVNRTAGRWNVHGTDLGHPILHQDRLYLVFGDTWGADGVEGAQWRSNVMAVVDDPDPRDGLHFESMIAGGPLGARELLGSLKVRGREKTVIPTNGISVNGRMFLHYMSVRTWDAPGRWTLNHSGLARSDDGRTWFKDAHARWPGDSNFGQVAFVEHQAHVYLFGIPAGRFGGAALARVAKAAGLLDPAAYEYWDGVRWQPDHRAAVAVVPAPVGELSVRWSPTHDRWVMMYLDENRHAIVLRTAERLTGPWDDPRVVTTAREHPQLYAPYLLPESGTGNDLYFTMSKFGPYQVFLMRTRLEPAAP